MLKLIFISEDKLGHRYSWKYLLQDFSWGIQRPYRSVSILFRISK